MNEQMIKNDPVKAMREENKKTNLFNGVAILKDDEVEMFVIYHEACDTDIMGLSDDNDFSDVLDKVLEHLGECDPDEEDDNDPWEDSLDDEEIESL